MKKTILLIFFISLLEKECQAQTNTFPSSGNVGVGTTAPQALLHVTNLFLAERTGAGTDFPNIRLVNNTSPSNISYEHRAELYLDNGTGSFSFRNTTGKGYSFINSFASGSLLNILDNGNVGISNTTPAYKLDVAGITRAASYFVDAGMSSYSGDYQFRSADAYRGRLIWYSSAYAGLPSNSITVENPTGVPIASFFENGNTAFGGNVAIGTTNDHGYKLAVNGNVLAQKMRITQTGWPDYVFYPSYHLLSLTEVEAYIKVNKHLPGVSSAKQIEDNGLDVGENQAALLKKIEELTLYLIDINKRLEEQKALVEQQQKLIMEQAKLLAQIQKTEK